MEWFQKDRFYLFSQCYIEFLYLYRDTKDPEKPKESWERRMELEESGSLTSDNTIKLQSSKQCDTGTKQKCRSMEQDRKSRDKAKYPWSPNLWQKKQEYTVEKETLFNNWCQKNRTATCKRMKLENYLTPYKKINPKWIKDLNVRPETLKLLEENIGRILNDINQSKLLYDPPPWVMEIKTKVNNWDLIKFKSFCTGKETISKVKRQPS